MRSVTKKFFLVILGVSLISTYGFSQNDEGDEKKGFRKENLFTGGSVTVSFFSGGSILGANPYFGYQLADWVDAGIALNYTYQGQRDNYVLNDKIRQHVFGPGFFTRIYPLRMIFLQGQIEQNYTNITYSYAGQKIKDHANATSLLLGGGIAQGRQRGSNTFYYISLLFDVLKNKNSPYVNNVYNQSTIIRTDIVPIIRAGVNIALFQGRNNRYEERGSGGKQPRNYNRY